MKVYKDALKFILKNGIKSEDRTGEGTISYFGYQLRFDLSKGFPAVTTKKLAWKSVLSELLWFLEGSSDEQRLSQILHGNRSLDNFTIWTDNAQNQGKKLGYLNNELGPVYGYHWRYMYNNECFPVKTKKSVNTPFSLPNKNISNIENEHLNFDGFSPTYYGVGMLGNYKNLKVSEIEKRLRKTWEKMISSCYNQDDKQFKENKQKNITVCDKWLVLSEFIKDAKQLDGWLWYVRNKNVVLDNNYYGNNTIYCPETTVFVPKEHSKKYENDEIPVMVLKNKSPTRYFISIKEYKKDLPLGKVQTYENEGFVVRHQFPVDQISDLIQQIKTNPNSRRLLLSSLDVGSVDKASLPPCHTMSQFYVRDGKLSCQMYQRSADFFLGVPFNIASYALLTHILAHICDLEVGEFVHTFGDAHIYLNHVDKVEKQLKRKPFELPFLNIKTNNKDIDKFTMQDFELIGYKHHKAIKGKMAV